MPTEEFARSIAANLSYWLERSCGLDDRMLHELDEERHNLFRAVRFGLGLEKSQCDAAGLILQIYPLIERRGYWRRWIPLLEQAVKNCTEYDKRLGVRLLDRLGQCCRLNRQWDASKARHQEEEGLARALGDVKLIAKAQLNLSQTYWSMRQYDEAARLGERAYAGFIQAGGNGDQMGAVASNLGLIALGRGDLETAKKWLEEAIAAYRSIERPALLGRSLMNLTITLERAGRIEEALVHCREASVVLEPTEHELDKVRVLLTLGTLYMRLERWGEALKAYDRANSPVLRRSGNVYLMSLAANNLGSVYLQLGRLEESEIALLKSIEFGRRSGGRLMLANCLGSMAETKLAMKRPQEAMPYLDEAIAIAEEYPDDGWGRQLLKEYEELRVKSNE